MDGSGKGYEFSIKIVFKDVDLGCKSQISNDGAVVQNTFRMYVCLPTIPRFSPDKYKRSEASVICIPARRPVVLILKG